MLPLARHRPTEPTLLADRAIAREERVGFSFMLWGRLAVLGLLALWVVVTVPEERSGTYLALIATFAVAGTLPWLLARRRTGGFVAIAVLMAIEAGVLTYLLVVPMPFDIESWTPQLNLRLPGFLYLGVFLVSVGLSYSPGLVVWVGAVSIAAWSAGYYHVATQPDTVLMWPLDLLDERVTSEAFIDRYLDPLAVRPNFFLNQVAFLSAVTVVLALTVWRSRTLVRRVLAAERQREQALEHQRFVRETFGRFVPEAVVSQILGDRGQLAPKRRLATVLFADLEGFTALSKRVPPERLLQILNEYFDAAGAIVTRNGGTITQFQGDALLASFNVPVDDPDHARHAVDAARALLAMSRTRTFQGEALGVRVGINTGEVAAGAVGGADRLTYTVHGECVNIAARLEQLNKTTGTRILMTTATAERVRDKMDLVAMGAFEIRGVSIPLHLFSIR